MYFSLGHPKSLRELNIAPVDILKAKRQVDIAVLDDEPFLRAETLATHGFMIKELGGDIKTVSTVSEYPIVICDIKGVGRAFGSQHEGAHVLHEIRKTYPDKYLIAFTGMNYDVTYNEKLNSADKSVTKDATVDHWTQILEEALKIVADPIERWLRVRRSLLNRRVELFDIMKVEQAFIKSIQKGDPSILRNTAVGEAKNTDAMDIVVKFAVAGLAQLIEGLAK